jgi:DNA-directed RNA polymerase subunit RPC12/RpoP
MTMKLGAFKCSKCIGVVLIDTSLLVPNAYVGCPYCGNRFVMQGTRYPSHAGEMLPARATLSWPDNFDKASVELHTDKEQP